MANPKPLHHGPVFGLAIMALFALMIPVVTIANSRSKATSADAMMMRNPGNTPTPVKVPLNPTGTESPKPTAKPSMNYTY